MFVTAFAYILTYVARHCLNIHLISDQSTPFCLYSLFITFVAPAMSTNTCTLSRPLWARFVAVSGRRLPAGSSLS